MIYIHPSADVQSKNIGDGTKIWQFCVVLPGAKIGRECNINAFVFIENDVVIGNRVTIKSGVQLWDGVRIDNDVFLGPNVSFTNDLRPRRWKRPAKFIKTWIDQGASIGANATIVAGCRIGKYAMVGAGSVVTKDVPSFALAYGVPATVQGYVCRCGNKVDRAGEACSDCREGDKCL